MFDSDLGMVIENCLYVVCARDELFVKIIHIKQNGCALRTLEKNLQIENVGVRYVDTDIDIYYRSVLGYIYDCIFGPSFGCIWRGGDGQIKRAGEGGKKWDRYGNANVGAKDKYKDKNSTKIAQRHHQQPIHISYNL